MSVLNANTGLITLSPFELGSAYNYTPSPTDTNIHGSLLFTGNPSAPVAISANIIKYSMYMDYSVGPFNFGEIGLYHAGQLFALGVSSTLIDKLAMGPGPGNSIRIDIYLSVVGSNYTMWFDLAESNNAFHMAILPSVDALPQSANATPNAYIVQGADSTQSAIFAFTDGVGLWNFDCYQYNNIGVASIIATDNMSVTIALSQYNPAMHPTYLGQTILEFTSGPLYSACRYIATAVQSGSRVTLGFSTTLAMLPDIGDTIQVIQRVAASTSNTSLPIATRTTLGAVIVGTGLSIDIAGNLSIGSNVVTSINTQTGDVFLNAGNLPGLSSAIFDEGTF